MWFEFKDICRKCSHVVHDNVSWYGKLHVGIEFIFESVSDNEIVIHLWPYNNHRAEQENVLQVT